MIMSLTELEQHVYAYYVATDAGQFSAAPRFYPHGELTLIFADKVQVATRKFGRSVHSKSKAAAVALIDKLIEAGAYSTKQNEFGGSMHQFQEPAYKAFLKAERESNPIIKQAKDGGAEFWEAAFARLTGQ
jgi:hypothetical protein